MAPKKTPAATSNGSKKITDWFSRVSGPQASSFPISSLAQIKQPRIPPCAGQEAIPVSSVSYLKDSSRTRPVIIVSDPSSTPATRATTATVNCVPPPPTRAAAKPMSKASSSSSTKMPLKRTTRTDSDSELDEGSGTIRIPHSQTRVPLPSTSVASDKENIKQRTSSTRKKPRISSPDPRSPPSPTPVGPREVRVPSSQSEEEELVRQPIACDPDAIMEDVDRWRNDTVMESDPAVLDDCEMTVPEPPEAIPMECEDQSTTRECTPEPRASQPTMLTTPQRIRPHPSLPNTPVPYTAESKAAKMIAEIRARAQAAVAAASSPESSPQMELRELDDSDEEDFLEMPKARADPFIVTKVESPPRRELRERKQAKIERLSPSPLPVKRRKELPFASIIREHRLGEKKGTGMAAVRRAEAAMRESTPLSVDDWDEIEDDSPSSCNSSDGVLLNNVDQVRLFGEETGKAIGGILDRERANRQEAREKRKISGVPLWDLAQVPIDTNVLVPTFPEYARKHPVLDMLRSSINRGNYSRAALLLNCDILSTLDLEDSTMEYLFELAMAPRVTPLTKPALNAMLHVCRTRAVPLRTLQMALLRLGANPCALRDLGWDLSATRSECGAEREGPLFSIVQLVAASVDSLRHSPSVIPHFIMAVLLIAMDPATSSQLCREITVIIDRLCHALSPEPDIICATLEIDLCNQLIKFTSEIEPVNQARAVSLVAGGSRRTMRIARWLSYAILTNTESLSPQSYGNLPPLQVLLDQAILPDRSADGSHGIFELHEGTDYVNLALHVHILGVAVSDVEGYVWADRQRILELACTSPSKSSSAVESDLTMVREGIEKLHSRIVDTRAAHLDRSRAKAALKQLSMRIHYQQQAAMRSKLKGKAHIKQYFRPS